MELIPIASVILGTLLSAGMAALTLWLFKLDERLFIIAKDVATRQEINERLDKLEKAIDNLAICFKNRRVGDNDGN